MGRFGAFGGQIPDFCGNDGETSAVFTGAGSLDGCIEGQYICLEGNIFNCADNCSIYEQLYHSLFNISNVNPPG